MILVETELDGAAHAELTLTGISHRALHLQPAFRLAEHVLEHGESSPFRGGQLTDTGRLRASLTQPFANDAIREAHGDELVFGTSVPYARAAASKAGERILLLSQREQKEISKLMIHYVVDGA